MSKNKQYIAVLYMHADIIGVEGPTDKDTAVKGCKDWCHGRSGAAAVLKEVGESVMVYTYDPDEEPSPVDSLTMYCFSIGDKSIYIHTDDERDAFDYIKNIFLGCDCDDSILDVVEVRIPRCDAEVVIVGGVVVFDTHTAKSVVVDHIKSSDNT